MSKLKPFLLYDWECGGKKGKKEEIWDQGNVLVQIQHFWDLWVIFHSVAQKEWQMIPVVLQRLNVKGDRAISVGSSLTITPCSVKEKKCFKTKGKKNPKSFNFLSTVYPQRLWGLYVILTLQIFIACISWWGKFFMEILKLTADQSMHP